MKKTEEILSEDSEYRSKTESIINSLDDKLKSFVSFKDELSVREDVDQVFLELIKKQVASIESRIKTLNEILTIKAETVKEAENIRKSLDSISDLMERKGNINNEAAILPASQYESLNMEVELLKANLEALEATTKERGAYLADSNTSMESTRLKIKEEKRKFEDDLKITKSQKPLTPEDSKLIKHKTEYLVDEISLQDDKTDLLLARNNLAKLRLDSINTQILNIKSEIEIKSEIASILLKRFEDEEAEKKKIEIEKEQKIEEERKRVAIEQKAKVEEEKEKALKKAEIAVQKQLVETSPEKKRILELEADVHKHNSLVATLKDELITEDTERFNDRSEFKKKLKEIEDILDGENTPSEISEELNTIDMEIKMIVDKATAIQELITATKKQRSIISEGLDKGRAELLPSVPGEKSPLEKEVEEFQDKALGEQLITLANKRLKYLEKQDELIGNKIERLNERAEVAKILLLKLTESKKELSQIKAANVWARRESNITTKTIIAPVSDIKLIMKTGFGLYRDSIQGLRKLSIYLSEKKNIPVFVLKVFIIVAVIFSSYFARRHLKRWAKKKIQELTSLSPQRVFVSKFIPGLLYIMQGTLTMLFLFIISLTISLTIPSNAPIIRSAINGFAIILIYKCLKGLLVEALSPYIGLRRWTTIAYFYAKRLFRGISTLLIFSAVMLTMISVLNAYNYKNDVIELLRFIYRMVTIFLVIWIATGQRSILLKKVMPPADTALHKFINKIINIIYPLLVIFIISLIAIRNLGYVQLSLTLTVTLIKAVISAGVAYFIYWFILRQLSHLQERRLKEEKALEPEKFEIEERSINIKFNIYKNLLAYGTLIITLVVIFSIWNNTFKDVVSSPAAPELFREVYNKTTFIFVSIKNSLAHQFVVSEGRYTTPFRILLGILALVIAFIGTRLLRNTLKKRVFEKSRIELSSQHAIASSLTYILIGIAAIIGLNIAGIPLRSLAIFAGAFGIGIGFGMQNIISNLVSGIIIMFERPIKVGDVITIDNNIKGVVDRISIRSTVIKSFDRTSVVVPNSKFLESNVVNWIHDKDIILRAKIPVGVAYGSNTELVRECLLKVAKSHPDVLGVPEPIVRFAEFGDSALIFQLYFWANIDKRWMAISDINFEIDRVFRENNIEIAFPQRDIHIRSIPQNMSEVTRSIGKDGNG